MGNYKIEAGTAQHIGSRTLQQDRVALYTAAGAPGYVMAVLADAGAGGGVIAADQVLLTSKHLLDEFRPGEAPGTARLHGLLRQIAAEAHQIIRMNPIAAASEPQAAMVVLLLTPLGQALWAHVGDARLYYFAGQHCVERSNDAAYVAHLVEVDQLPPEAAAKHRATRALHNVLGHSLKPPFVTVGGHQGLGPGDSFLLCSDGLWQYFTDGELAAVLARNTPRQASELLINKAIERAKGKGDNCSMAIVKLVAPPDAEAIAGRKNTRVP
ncbi:PP2C family protein-serine/threonine phosphatase [Rugamonas sp. CCM 8940]|uniref:PP2C family protein-serine/threonine phosphatase n=1 Tax=Rugamonas sp. CCM 8940 TaxID=2765359 RepID=UPI0018F58CB8|nr:protein phosphatase 2C domain-containing protein [Rugamonas sp. CCM 8940]MBJ7310985.1 protein phosphatase 2C domain-containing protein [Rugamonas sp. CCM 8940]